MGVDWNEQYKDNIQGYICNGQKLAPAVKVTVGTSRFPRNGSFEWNYPNETSEEHNTVRSTLEADESLDQTFHEQSKRKLRRDCKHTGPSTSFKLCTRSSRYSILPSKILPSLVLSMGTICDRDRCVRASRKPCLSLLRSHTS